MPRGIDLVLMVEGATQGTWLPVAGQRNATFSEERETIDITSKDSVGGYTEADYGLGSWSISADGLYVFGDAGFKKLKDAMRNRTKIKAQWKETGSKGETEEGTVLVTSRELEAPYDAEVTYSVELTGSGAITTTVNP